MLLQGLDLLLYGLPILPVFIVAYPKIGIRIDIERLTLYFEVKIGGVAPHHGVVLAYIKISIRRSSVIALNVLLKRKCLV
jgi:hypothetical protein